YRALNRCAEALPAYEKYLALKPESRFTERVKKEIELCRVKLGQNKPQPAQPTAAATGTPTTTPPPQSAGGQQAHPETAQGILHVAANLIGGEATDEATVKVDGLVRGATPMTIPVTAGVHKIDLARMGFESASTTVEVGPGERRDVELTINKLQQAAIVPIVSPTGSSQSTVPTEESSGPKKSYAKYGWILIGVAAATGAVGAGFGIAESKLHRDAVAADPSMTSRGYVDDKRHTGQIYGDVAEVGLAVGGAALLAGAIVFLIDPSRGETHAPQKYVVAPALDRNGGSLVATVRF
ncbi:MAG TPA: PEGA domain-containing protein, partial [Polyangia bacterium]|nr:PEGA domain-containing protein [Polyangia bacterium]